MNSKKIIICGLPSSGKSSFLAALGHLLTGDELPTALSLKNLPETRDYLLYLAQKWVRYTELERTPSETLKEIHLTLTSDTEEINLYAPDMSGETWESLWVDRSCSEKVAEWSNDACGVLLFVHADKITPAVPIPTLKNMSGDKGDATGVEATEWIASKSPTAVILTDILQALAKSPLGSKSRRLVVILSAWDMVRSMGLTPDEYLSSHLPLLQQYLINNRDYAGYEIFGVSALGGRITSDTIRQENIPSRRIQVVPQYSVDHVYDLTLPIMSLI